MENLSTKEITIGTLNAWLVNDKAVAEKIIQNHWDINVDYSDWHNQIIENFIETADSLGFGIDFSDIQYTGFNSQGDGASFTCEIDLIGFLRGTKHLSHFKALRRAIDNDIIADTVSVERGHSNYSHENTCYVNDIEVYSWEDDLTELQASQLEGIQELLEEKRLELCSELYSSLEKAYDELTSRESIISTLCANEYEFTELAEIA